MNQPKNQRENEFLKELTHLHKIWRLKKKRLKWWKMETGYYGDNIRKICNIPLPHPDSHILIGCIYILHLDYITKATSCNQVRLKILRYREKVFTALKLSMEKYNIQTSKEGVFPWSLSQSVARKE